VLAKYADLLCAVPLPTYSPKLNLIERRRCFLRRKVMRNYLFECITDLVTAVERFLADMNNNRAETLFVIGNLQ
jgi:hypothetical protein